MRRAFRESGVEGRLRLAFTECLGPCSEANVVFLYLSGRPLWLRRVNDVDTFTAILEWARGAVDGQHRPLSPALAARSFAWTGGGEGPAPPIDG
jgi:(2Fe-2S) ferredoxin